MGKTSFRIYAGGLLIAVLARALLKILFVDTVTGFYVSGEFLGLVFWAFMALTAALIAYCAWKEPAGTVFLVRGNSAAALSLTALGAAVFYGGVEAFIFPVQEQLMGIAAGMYGIVYFLYFVGGAALLCLGVLCFIGAPQGILMGLLSLGAVLWQVFDLIYRFSSFMTVTTASDQLLEVLYLVSATLFLLYHAGAVCGADPGRSLKLSRLYGYLTSFAGFTLSAGQLAGHSVLGRQGTGPYDARLVVVLLMSLYGLLYARRIDKEYR
jgi:hypothetical protein